MKSRNFRIASIGAMALVAFTYGLLVGRFRYFPYRHIQLIYRVFYHPGADPAFERKGLWREAQDGRDSSTGEDAGDKLKVVPYLGGYKNAPPKSGVTVYMPEKCASGLNFCVSGNAPGAFIMDMEGNVLHRWGKTCDEVWPGEKTPLEPSLHRTFWRRAHLYPNGDILAIFEGIGIVKLDKNSNIVWANKCRAHHDIYIHGNGNIYTLTRKNVTEQNGGKLKNPYIEDYIAILGPDGKLLREISLLKCFLNSDYYSMALKARRLGGDIFHTNTVEVISGPGAGGNEVFKPGMILVSFRTFSTIALVDPDAQKVVWALTGMFLYQHQPTLLPNGNLMLFDNSGAGGRSRVIEFDPMSQKILWSYGSEENPLYSQYCGFNQLLPNGNVLITETDNGRALEVTRDREKVWEYISPLRAGENNELIASLLEVIRIPPGQIDCSERGCFRADSTLEAPAEP